MKFQLIIFTIIVLGGFVLYYLSHPLISKIRVGNTIITIEVAVTEAQKQKGLGGRSGLPDNHGMLFPYDHKEQFEFWMRGMQFPLDFIWIDGKTVADISENIPPPEGAEKPVIIKPSVPVDRVLEVNAGSVALIGIKVGDTVEYIDR